MTDTEVKTPKSVAPMALVPIPSGKARSTRRRKGKKTLRKVKTFYEMLVRRALRCTYKPAGQTRQTLVKFIRRRYDLGRQGGTKISNAMYKMLCNGYMYRNRFSPLRFKLTMKGYRMKKADLKKKKRVKKTKRRRRRVQRRRRAARRKRKTVC